eukprot:c964_g1_i1.p1 GENE.c964_g1_i1~~c964_g1_i1.p1  ORF type:complete len:542 (+),score=108.67 c964_g1_i1:2-1627(+)
MGWGCCGTCRAREMAFVRARKLVVPVVATTAVGLGVAWGLENKHKIESNVRLVRCARTILTMSVDYWLVSKRKEWEPEKAERELHLAHRRNAVRLRELVFKNKGIYIKVGQHLAILTYILPLEYTDELAECFEQAPVSSIKDIDRIFREDFNGRGTKDLFSSFDEQPMASASLAQVHRATTHDGHSVAVKIQHPHLKDSAPSEIAAVEKMVGWARWLQPEFGFEWLVEEMKLNLPQELDFCLEAANADKCREMIRGFGDRVVVPRIQHALTTHRVLVMDYELGCRLNRPDLISQQGLSPASAGRLLTQVFCEMIFKHGFVHCDPHPGNVLVRPHPRHRSHPQLVILDHGLYRQLPHDIRILYCQLWKAVITANTKEIENASNAMGITSPWMKQRYTEGDFTYRLIASMLMAHPWDVIADSGTSVKRFQDFADSSRGSLHANVGEYLRGIVDVLETCPRPVLLMLKTNDCLRSVSFDLGVSTLDTCLLTARACIQALIREIPKRTEYSFFERIRSYVGLTIAWVWCDVLLLSCNVQGSLGWA